VGIGKKARLIGILALVVVGAAMLSIGCGGGDKIDLSGKDNGSATSAPKKTATSENSDNSDNSDSTGNSSGDADKYASQVCKAIGKYADDIQAMSDSTADMSDPSQLKDLVSQMTPVFEGMSKDLDKINPPDDVAEWHDAMVKALASAADIFGKMETALDKPLDEAMADITDLSSEMSDMGDPFGTLGDLPSAYQTAFDNNSDCQDLQNLQVFQ
jgi:hypothetical protein